MDMFLDTVLRKRYIAKQRIQELETLATCEVIDVTGDEVQIDSKGIAVSEVLERREITKAALAHSYKKIQVKTEKIKLHAELQNSLQQKASVLLQNQAVNWQWEDGALNSGWWHDFSLDQAIKIETCRQRLLCFGIHETNPEHVNFAADADSGRSCNEPATDRLQK